MHRIFSHGCSSVNRYFHLFVYINLLTNVKVTCVTLAVNVLREDKYYESEVVVNT